MRDFIMNNFDAVTGLLLAAAFFIYALFTKQWWLLRATAYKFMLDAERIISTKEGKAKMDAVYTAIWEQLPKWIKRFVTEKTLREKLQQWYNIAKNSLGGESEEITTTSST